MSAGLGARAAQKAQTRMRVLSCARGLFLTKGFDETQIREVAEAAEVAVGTVLAHYPSKTDLFTAVLEAEYAATAAVMRAADPGVGVAEERLGAMFDAAYQLHFEALDIVRAGNLASWARTQAGDAANRSALSVFVGMIVEVIADDAQHRGASLGQPFTLAAEMLIELYLTSFRRAVYGGWSATRLGALFRQQIELVLAGVRAAA